jgi:trehalose 6-phosphate phosphatase
MDRNDEMKLPDFSRNWALFLDVDGSLLDIAQRPDAVRVAPETQRLLMRLQSVTGGALALISGRSLEDVDALFSPLVLPAAGEHGVERRDADGNVHYRIFDGNLLRRAAKRLEAVAAGHEGLILEPKRYSLALHYRLAPEMGERVRSAVQAEAAAQGDAFEVQAGKCVYELKPAGINKGTAIAQFMREKPFAERVPVFVGDDLTDEYGFEIVNRLGGHSIKVGTGPTAARFGLEDAVAVRRWLAECLASVMPAGRSTHPTSTGAAPKQ